MRRLALAAGIAIALAGGGTAAGLLLTRGHARSGATVVQTVEVPANGNSLRFLHSFWTRGRNRPLVPRLAVFRRRARPSDRWPDAFLAGAAQNGGMLLSRSRLVLAGPVAVYAAPTRRGSVCYVTASADRGCEQELPRGYGLQFTTSGQHIAVFGLLEDGVQVTAAAGGKRLVVHLGENAYFVELPRPFPRHGRLAFHRADGTDAVVLVKPGAGR
jgi:hypothetical protein